MDGIVAELHGSVRNSDGTSPPSRPDLANFDYIRLVAASAVIFSHSFLLADGHERNEPFVRMLGEKNILGLYGVFTFFIISGFLITQSACTSRSVGAFAWSRILRIYPALICCAAFCGVVLGSIFTVVPLMDYWMRLLPLDYTASTSLLPGSRGWSIPTVIFYPGGGLLAEGMNGSLWTIPQELTCYVIVGLLFLVRGLRWHVAAAICALFLPLMLLPFPIVPKMLSDFLFVAPSFAYRRTYLFALAPADAAAVAVVYLRGHCGGCCMGGQGAPVFPAFRCLSADPPRDRPALSPAKSQEVWRRILRHVSLWLADRTGRAGAARRSHIMVGDIRDSIARFGGATIRLLASARKARTAVQEMAAGSHGRKQP